MYINREESTDYKVRVKPGVNIAECKLQLRCQSWEARHGSSIVSRKENQDNVVPDHFISEEATRMGNTHHQSLGGPDVMPMARTFLSLICYNGWLRHGCKLDLTPCSSIHKLYLQLQRVKARQGKS